MLVSGAVLLLDKPHFLAQQDRAVHTMEAIQAHIPAVVQSFVKPYTELPILLYTLRAITMDHLLETPYICNL